MGSKNKKSGGKKKRSGAKNTEAPAKSQPESGCEAGTEMEETGAEKSPGHIESSSSPSKKRKSGSDDGEVKLDPSDGTSAAGGRAGKGKKLKSGRDGGRVEDLSSGALARQLRPRKQPKFFQDVTLAEGDATHVIGRGIKVFWPLDDEWYTGHVKEFRAKTKQHHVVYDDGEEEWLVLKKERIKIQVELGEVFGESMGANAVVPSKVPLNAKEVQIGVEKGKEIGTGSSDDGKKNGVKEKESGVVGDGKKTGAKRKKRSTVDNSEKNDGKRKKAGEGNAGKEGKKKEENGGKSKLVEDMNDDGGIKEGGGGNVTENKYEEDQDTRQVDAVGDGSVKNEAEEKKENKDRIENEAQGQGQSAVDGKIAKRPKNSKKTAPRTKRVGSGKQIQQKLVAEDQTEDADTKQEKVEHIDAKQDIKRDEDSRFTENANSKVVNVPEVDSTCNDDGEDWQKAKESVLFSRKKVDSSVPAGPETYTVDDVGAKQSVKDVRKQPDQAEKCDEKNTNAVVAEQLHELPKVDVLRQPNEDELFRPPTIDQSSEKHSDARGSDEKVIEDQVDIKDDQLSKKHNKKSRMKGKSREPGKK